MPAVVVWDSLQLVFLLFICLTEPFRAGFHVIVAPGEWMFGVDIFLDLFFTIDIVLQFFNSYKEMEHDQLPVTDLRKTASHYLGSRWIWVDVVSVFPFTYIFRPWERDASRGNLRWLRFLRLHRLIKLLRVVRVKRVIKRYAEIWPAMRQVLHNWDHLIMMIKIVLLAHCVGCLWFFFSHDYSNPECYGDPECDSWVQHAFPDEPFDYDCAIAASSSSGAVDETDADSCYADRDRGWFKSRYITSLYWAFTTITTVGYGDITAKNNWEKGLSILFMVVGMQVFTNVASQLKTWADNQNAVELAADNQISLLMGYLKQRQVKEDLQNDIRDFYTIKYRKHETPGFDHDEMLRDLPPTLAEDLAEHLYDKPATTVLVVQVSY